MHSRSTRPVLAIALSLFALASTARAATFDVIWSDHVTVTTYPSNIGFVPDDDIALVVNKGSTDINGPEFFGATLTCTSTNPAVTGFPIIFDSPGPSIMPIHPNQAIGTVSGENAVLPTKLLPGETFHNTWPRQVISITVNYPPNFAGSAQLDLSMTMGGNIAHYSIQMTFIAGSVFSLTFDSAARTSAVPVPTPARQSTWGRLKKLYR